MRKNILIWSISLLFLTEGCTLSTWYNSTNKVSVFSSEQKTDLESKSPLFREGYDAGCATAHGEYTKDSKKFNSEDEYKNGWFAGRSSCQYDSYNMKSTTK